MAAIYGRAYAAERSRGIAPALAGEGARAVCDDFLAWVAERRGGAR